MARLAWLGIAGPPGQLIDRDEMPDRGQCVRGQKETPLDGDSGAMVRWRSKMACGNATHSAYLVHPPYRKGVGYTYWQRDVDVPAKARLEFFTGMSEKAPQRSDGVTFRVLVAEKSGEDVGPFKPIFEHSQKANEWIAHQVSLEPWAGKTVRLKFISDCGPADNSTTDLSYWGDAQVVSGPARPRSDPVRHMTWAGKDDFTATFYFSNVRSPHVDLEFSIEGGEPVWIGPTAFMPLRTPCFASSSTASCWPIPARAPTRSTWPASARAASSAG